jgi:hypothetical protein
MTHYEGCDHEARRAVVSHRQNIAFTPPSREAFGSATRLDASETQLESLRARRRMSVLGHSPQNRSRRCDDDACALNQHPRRTPRGQLRSAEGEFSGMAEEVTRGKAGTAGAVGSERHQHRRGRRTSSPRARQRGSGRCYRRRRDACHGAANRVRNSHPAWR